MRRLALVREQMDSLKRSSQAVSAELLTGMLGFAAPMLLALGSRAAFNVPQPLVQTVTTNVPGPRVPLYILGRRMEAAYPYVPIGNNLRIAVAIFSYLDTISFGVTADYSAVPDVEVLREGIGRGLAELGSRAAAVTATNSAVPPKPAAGAGQSAGSRSGAAPKSSATQKSGSSRRSRISPAPGSTATS
jgi:hypothetical protein